LGKGVSSFFCTTLPKRYDYSQSGTCPLVHPNYFSLLVDTTNNIANPNPNPNPNPKNNWDK